MRPDNMDDSLMDINWRLAMNFRRISHALHNFPNGKTSQKRILLILNDFGETTQKELTGRLKVTTASASEILRKMESYGLIERRISSEDRRVMCICLTKKGKEEAVKAKQETTRMYKKIFDGLKEEEREELLRLMEKLNKDWEQRYPDFRHHDHGHRRDQHEEE